jgi:hypothetical protein
MARRALKLCLSPPPETEINVTPCSTLHSPSHTAYPSLMPSKETMAATQEIQAITMQGKYDLSSTESNANLEVGLITDKFAGAYGDALADLADIQRLGKKQEFNV